MSGEKVFNHTGHKALWDFLARNPSAYKADWEGWADYNEDVMSEYCYCFACQYSNSYSIGCAHCPLSWTGNRNCFIDGGLYDRWNCEKDLLKRARLAAKIRDLPVREGVECE